MRCLGALERGVGDAADDLDGEARGSLAVERVQADDLRAALGVLAAEEAPLANVAWGKSPFSQLLDKF